MCGSKGPIWDQQGSGPTTEQIQQYWQEKGVILPTTEQAKAKTVPPFVEDEEEMRIKDYRSILVNKNKEPLPRFPMAYSKYDAINGYGWQDRGRAADGLATWAPMIGKGLLPWLERPAHYYAKGKDLPILPSGDGWTQGETAAPLGFSLTRPSPSVSAALVLVR